MVEHLLGEVVASDLNAPPTANGLIENFLCDSALRMMLSIIPIIARSQRVRGSLIQSSSALRGLCRWRDAKSKVYPDAPLRGRLSSKDASSCDTRVVMVLRPCCLKPPRATPCGVFASDGMVAVHESERQVPTKLTCNHGT